MHASSFSHFQTPHVCWALPDFKCLSSSVWRTALLTSMLPHSINPQGSKIRTVHFYTLHVNGIMTHTVIFRNKSLAEGINHPRNDFIAKIETPTWLSLAFPRDPSPFQVMSGKQRAIQPIACRLTPSNTLSRTIPGCAHWSPGGVISLHTHNCIGANPNSTGRKHTYWRYLTQQHSLWWWQRHKHMTKL